MGNLNRPRGTGRIIAPSATALGVHYSVSSEQLFTVEEVDCFIKLYEENGADERLLHDFLKANPKFLFALGCYDSLLSELTFPANISNPQAKASNLRLDFLVRDKRGTWDIVEIKQANVSPSSLVVGSPARRRFSAKIEESVAQVRTYLREIENPAAQDFFNNAGIIIEQPQAWLITGRDRALPLAERRMLESNLPHRLRLVTYDELAALAKERTLIVRPSVVMPRRYTQPASPAGKRVNLVLSTTAYEEMVALSRASSRSLTELVRLGLGLVKIASSATSSGNRLIVTTGDGDPVKEIVLPGL